MERLLNAFKNSGRAWAYLVRHETSFKQEIAALALGLPLAWVLSGDWVTYMLLIGVIVLVIIVEVLNTGIEMACNAITREFSPEIKIAKDCGSLAVLSSCIFGLCVWLFAFGDALMRWI